MQAWDQAGGKSIAWTQTLVRMDSEVSGDLDSNASESFESASDIYIYFHWQVLTPCDSFELWTPSPERSHPSQVRVTVTKVSRDHQVRG